MHALARASVYDPSRSSWLHTAYTHFAYCDRVNVFLAVDVLFRLPRVHVFNGGRRGNVNAKAPAGKKRREYNWWYTVYPCKQLVVYSIPVFHHAVWLNVVITHILQYTHGRDHMVATASTSSDRSEL